MKSAVFALAAFLFLQNAACLPFEEQLGNNQQARSEFVHSLAKESVQISSKAVPDAPVTGARTCHDLMTVDRGLPEGVYYIDPDGATTGEPPIRVECTKSGETRVLHDTLLTTDVGHCYDPGCYSKSITYDTSSLRQLKALIELSKDCSQSIRYDCVSAVFAFQNIPYSWWNDRNGEKRYYWDKAGDPENPDFHTCQCGYTGKCLEKGLSCNCDSDAPEAYFDEGVITNREHLPITQLNFGRTVKPESTGLHTLGPLICSGNYYEALTAEEKVPTSCTDLWRAGHTASGIYQVQPTGTTDSLTAVFCDMTKLPGEEGQETEIGTSAIEPASVYFSVTRTTSYTSVGVVPFEVSLLNVGDAMDLATGQFKAPQKGIYSFAFTFRGGSYPTVVELQRNGHLVAKAAQTGETSGSIQTNIQLDVDDVVTVNLNEGGLQKDQSVVFTGSLLREI